MDTARTDFVPADSDYADQVRASFASQAMMKTLGGASPTWAPAGSTSSSTITRTSPSSRFKHAGAIATALDSACGYAAFSLMPADAAVLTVEYKINLPRPARSERYRVSASVLKPGRTLTVCSGTVKPADSDEAIAVMTATLMTLIGTDIKH